VSHRRGRITRRPEGVPLDLNKIRIARPCDVPWDSMKGDDRERFCEQCKQSVHNIANMTRDEVVKLIEKDGQPCMQVLRRKDGTVITRECRELRPPAMDDFKLTEMRGSIEIPIDPSKKDEPRRSRFGPGGKP